MDALRDASSALQLSEDICNNSKHYRRSGKVRVSATLGFQREFVPNGGRYGERWAVVTATPGFERSDLAELVSECFATWAKFCQARPLYDGRSVPLFFADAGTDSFLSLHKQV